MPIKFQNQIIDDEAKSMLISFDEGVYLFEIWFIVVSVPCIDICLYCVKTQCFFVYLSPITQTVYEQNQGSTAGKGNQTNLVGWKIEQKLQYCQWLL